MSRPVKHGLNYFYVVCDPEEKIDYLEAKHGIVGYGVLIKLWTKIYKQHGYWCDWTEKSEFLFSKEIGVSIENIRDIIETCYQENIFSRVMFERYSILTSSGVQKYFLSVCERAKRKNCSIDPKYSLSMKPLRETEFPADYSANTPVESTQREVEEKEEYTTGSKRSEGKEKLFGIVVGAAAAAPPQKNPPKKSLEKKQEEVLIREKEFYDSLRPFVSQYTKELIRKFYDYWREPNKSKTKMRFEFQKTWDLKLRLNTWERNNYKFANNGTHKQTSGKNHGKSTGLTKLADDLAREVGLDPG